MSLAARLPAVVVARLRADLGRLGIFVGTLGFFLLLFLLFLRFVPFVPLAEVKELKHELAEATERAR